MLQLKGNGLEAFNLETIEQEGELHQFPGTNLKLILVELSPDQWHSIVRASTQRIFDKKSRQYIEQENTSKSRKLVYEKSIKGCEGLTPRIVHEALKLKWNCGLEEDQEILFSSPEQMQLVLYAIGSKSARLNRFVYQRVIPDPSEIGDEVDAMEDEKKNLSDWFLEYFKLRHTNDPLAVREWEKEGLIVVNTATLPTVLLPGNESAKSVILSAFHFEAPTHEFRINPRSLSLIARQKFCTDPYLWDKAERVLVDLNNAKFQPKEEKKDGNIH